MNIWNCFNKVLSIQHIWKFEVVFATKYGRKENVILPFVAGSLHKTELGMPEIKGIAGPLDKSFEQMYRVFRGLEAPGAPMTLICCWPILLILMLPRQQHCREQPAFCCIGKGLWETVWESMIFWKIPKGRLLVWFMGGHEKTYLCPTNWSFTFLNRRKRKNLETEMS